MVRLGIISIWFIWVSQDWDSASLQRDLVGLGFARLNWIDLAEFG